jgi:hypothetical protein
LRDFQKRGLLKRAPSEHDGRQSHLSLTQRGQAAFAPHARSHDGIDAMPAPTRPSRRASSGDAHDRRHIGAQPSGRCRTCSAAQARRHGLGRSPPRRALHRGTAGTGASRRWSRAS